MFETNVFFFFFETYVKSNDIFKIDVKVIWILSVSESRFFFTQKEQFCWRIREFSYYRFKNNFVWIIKLE